MHFSLFSATGPQVLLIAVFTLTGAVVLLLLIALLVLRYLPPPLSRCAHHPKSGGGEREKSDVINDNIHRQEGV